MADQMVVIQLVVPVAALGLSLLTYLALRKKASAERLSAAEERLHVEIARLRDQIKRLEADIAECHGERRALERERVLLIERLAHWRGGEAR